MEYSLAVGRIQRFLEEEPIVWLSTVRPDGTPHIVPVWFWWDGEALLIFSKPNAQKVRNILAGSTVMLGVGDADEDFDIGLFERRAEILDASTAELLPSTHLEKYALQMAGIGLTAEDYSSTYSLVIRITPSHYLGWHGRSIPQSVRVAGAPLVTIEEPAPGRPSLREWLGEPLARVSVGSAPVCSDPTRQARSRIDAGAPYLALVASKATILPSVASDARPVAAWSGACT